MKDRLGELARCRIAAGLDEEATIIWFGVGRATIERIEAGEIEPVPEIERRIDRFLQFCGGQFTLSGSPPLPSSVVTHAGDALAGGARNGPAGLFGGSLHTSGGPR